MKKSFLLYFVILTCLCKCNNNSPTHSTSYKASFVTIAPGVRLELLDWGGNGEPILLLAGLGNSAHIFEDFAPQFVDHFHVMAVTRRGFGASSQPPTGYNPDTLALDILTLLDSLKIERISLIGHSIAGEELTKFAALYPERVSKLMYLDAAYDRTDMSFLAKAPSFPPMTANDSASIVNQQSYFLRVYGIQVGVPELRATGVFADSGRYIRDITPGSIYGALITGVEHPNYHAVKARALAFFAIADSTRDIIAFYDQLDSAGRKVANDFLPVVQINAQKQIDLFKKEMVAGQVIELHKANHYVFKSNPTDVATEIRKFLASR